MLRRGCWERFPIAWVRSNQASFVLVGLSLDENLRCTLTPGFLTHIKKHVIESYANTPNRILQVARVVDQAAAATSDDDKSMQVALSRIEQRLFSYYYAVRFICKVSYKGPSIKYVTLFLMIFDPPPSPLSQTVTNLGPPPLKVCHTSEQKVNKQILGKCRLPLNNFNRYCILNKNKRTYWVFLINPELPMKI